MLKLLTVILPFAISLVEHQSFAYTSDLKLTEWNQLSNEQRDSLVKLRESTFALDFEAGLMCTGTFISSDGHILTAEHCFRTCLNRALEEQRAINTKNYFEAKLRYHNSIAIEKKNGYSMAEFENLVISRNARPDQSIQTYEYDPTLYRGLKCTAKINGQFEQLTFVGGGSGSLFPFFSDEKKSHELTGNLLQLWQEKVSEGFGPGGDFGVWKIDRKNTPCISLSEVNAKPGEHLQTLSQTCRDGYTINRQGQMAFFSSGTDQTNELSNYRPHLTISPYRHTTIESDNCSSGSVVIGEDGSIKGVLTQSMSVVNKLVSPPIDLNFSSYIEVGFIKSHLTNKWQSVPFRCETM